jgi:type IX secretion system PorP/SprF family membrane protein
MRLFIKASLLYPFIFWGQQTPYITQFFNVKQNVNPALTGIGEKVSGFIALRQNWANTPINYLTNIVSLESPFSQQRIGLGLVAIQDNLPTERRIILRGNASYKINLLSGFMNFGLSAGYIHSRFDTQQLQIKDLSDPFLANIHNINYFSSSFGAAYKRGTYVLGLCVKNLNRPSTNYSALYGANSPTNRIYAFYIEKKIILSQTLTLINYLQTAYSTKQDWYLSYTPYFTYKNDLSLGIAYRTNTTVSIMGSIRLSRFAQNLDNLSICYAYEHGLGKLNNVTKNTHEIGIKIDFELSPKLKTIEKKPKEVSPLDF